MREKSANVLLLVSSTLLGAVGQFLFRSAFLSSSTFGVLLALGIVAYFVSTAIYLYVLSRVHLSFAYGMGGLSYVFAVLLAALLLGENVSPLRWTGIAAIAVGVALIGSS